MKTRSPLVRALPGAALLVTLLLAPVVAGPAPPPAPGRVVAVADVHGAYEEFVAILHDVGLINDQRAWAGGAATFVQTGDVVDRGARTRECLDLMMDLERQAPESGGTVIPLLGNHEVMNVIGDLRYVTKDIFRTFATAESAQRSDQAYAEYLAFLETHKGHGHAASPPSDAEARRAWRDEHPPGFFEYRDAFGPDGKYGRWIRAHRAVVQIGDGVFVHGGLSPSLEFGSVRELDERVMADLPAFDAMWKALVDGGVVWRYMTFAEAVRFASEELTWRQTEGPVGAYEPRAAIVRLLGYKTWITVSADGPLWYRGLATEPEGKLADGLKAMLARLGAAYIVSGHSVVASKTVTTRFDGRVFLIDTGMLAEAYAGRASALGIQDGHFIAYQVGGTPRELLPPPGVKAGVPGA
jgi:Calcineurin-like phosphoesterase